MQRTDGDTGVRLTFHKDLANQITLQMAPYHFCGLRGNTALAAYLHSRGVSPDRPFQIASFSANGATDGSPWAKAIVVSPQETALLAGNDETAEVLALIEEGVPLHWSRDGHEFFPDSFRHKVQPLMDALVSSPGFAALPGPVRVSVVDILLADMARSLVWRSVPSTSGLWGGPREVPDGESDLWAIAERLPLQQGGTSGEGAAAAEEAEAEDLPAYQFRMGLASIGRRRYLLRVLGRVSTGAAAVHVARSFGCYSVLPQAGLFISGFLAPVPALLVLSSIKLHQLSGNAHRN
jgi:hypothetical protein